MTTDKQHRGLGDKIAEFTEATGIKKLVKWAFGEDCGCKERQEKLNLLFPRRTKPDCLTEKEYNYLKEIKLDKLHSKSTVNAKTQRGMLPIYNRVFRKRQEFSNCPTCVAEVVHELQKVLIAYEN